MENKIKIVLSSLPHTWLIDIDGTIAKHNGYKLDSHDTLLLGVDEFFRKIPGDDTVILLTSRDEQYREITEEFLKENHIRYNHIIFGLPFGERVLVNDNKPSGLVMSHCFSLERDAGLLTEVIIDIDI